MALAQALERSNGSSGNGSVETWRGIAAAAESPSGERRIEVMVTKGAVTLALDDVFGGLEFRPILDSKGEPTGKERYGREITGIDADAVVGDFAFVDNPDKPDSVEVMRRLQGSDVTFLGSVAELVPLGSGVEPYVPTLPDGQLTLF